jgi:hypothetical protein
MTALGTARPGVDVPDARGRTGLHLTGRDLGANPDVVVRDVELLATFWHVLRRTGPGGGLGEDIEVVELDVDEALDQVADGRIADAKTMLLLQWAVLRGPFSGR